MSSLLRIGQVLKVRVGKYPLMTLDWRDQPTAKELLEDNWWKYDE